MKPKRQGFKAYLPDIAGVLLVAGLAYYALNRPEPVPDTSKAFPLRTLIVAGGPEPGGTNFNFDANAAFVERLTAEGPSQKVLFATGDEDISSVNFHTRRADADARDVFAWIFNDQYGTDDVEKVHLSSVKRIDGNITLDSILSSCQELATSTQAGEHALLYFTGRGERDPQAARGDKERPGYGGVSFLAWNREPLTVPKLAGALKNWPADRPLVLVMSQGYGSGFANLLFKDGDSKAPVVNRDFCAFFSNTSATEGAEGWEEGADEADQQDFASSFFAALSDETRDGDPVSGADSDGDGKVGMLEAYAWANVHARSTDEPICTSDSYLRRPTKPATAIQFPAPILTATAKSACWRPMPGPMSTPVPPTSPSVPPTPIYAGYCQPATLDGPKRPLRKRASTPCRGKRACWMASPRNSA